MLTVPILGSNLQECPISFPIQLSAFYNSRSTHTYSMYVHTACMYNSQPAHTYSMFVPCKTYNIHHTACMYHECTTLSPPSSLLIHQSLSAGSGGLQYIYDHLIFAVLGFQNARTVTLHCSGEATSVHCHFKATSVHPPTFADLFQQLPCADRVLLHLVKHTFLIHILEHQI